MDKYGIIASESIHHEGDERSRTHPGHGYPAWTEQVTKITEYKDQKAWEDAIRKKANPTYGAPDKFRAIVFREVEVQRHVKINIPR